MYSKDILYMQGEMEKIVYQSEKDSYAVASARVSRIEKLETDLHYHLLALSNYDVFCYP
jgi:hypothetical protein